MSLCAPVFIVFGHSLDFIISAAIMFCGGILSTQIAILVILPFFARIKHSNKIGYIALGVGFGLVLIIPLILCYFTLSWFVIHLYAMHFGHKVKLLAIDTSYTLGFVAICILVVVCLLLIGVTGYKLSLYAFKTRRKSTVRMILFSIFCYVLLGVVIDILYSCTIFVVFILSYFFGA
jgi:hypothetical protein